MKNLKTFDAAYLRMTGWYVLIIMTISLLFSFWVYNQARNELQTGLSRVVELKPLANDPKGFNAFVDDRLADSRQRLLGRLVILNTAVFALGAIASYWLARRTMRPIEESVEAQERFTADASHELRTPLAAMKTEIEVGLRDKKLNKETAVALLKSNLEEIDRLGSLADGLLALTQTDEAHTTLGRPVALDKVASKVIKRMQPLANAQKITIVSELQPVTALASQDVIDKIIGILTDNAIKYSPKDTTVTVRTYQKDNRICAEVQDQGMGIKASELPHIFDRFYRADSSRSKTHVPGHGLGLSIAQKLAENMEATISVSSTPGKGSVFTVCFSNYIQ